MEDILRLKCDCGADFERPSKFIRYQQTHPNIVFKWKLAYCDKCYKNKADNALKKLPKILEDILNTP